MKTETLTIPELCKRLGWKKKLSIEIEHFYVEEGDTLMAYYKNGIHKQEILSINDLFPTDEYEYSFEWKVKDGLGSVFFGDDIFYSKSKLDRQDILDGIWDGISSSQSTVAEIFGKELSVIDMGSNCDASCDSVKVSKLKIKPRLRTVKGIKLSERCECGHDGRKNKHVCMSIQVEPYKSKTHEICDSCGCKQYKPVQMVEVELKEERI